MNEETKIHLKGISAVIIMILAGCFMVHTCGRTNIMTPNFTKTIRATELNDSLTIALKIPYGDTLHTGDLVKAYKMPNGLEYNPAHIPEGTESIVVIVK